jgi:clan AA aspartic protease
MMYGLVDQNCEIKLRLVIGNGESERQTIDALLDTGFTGYLTLPIAILDRLNLAPYRRELGTLGDGSQCAFDVYRGFIIWDGTLQQIDINASESTPLVGMAMLYGDRVQFDEIEGGTAIIQAITL